MKTAGGAAMYRNGDVSRTKTTMITDKPAERAADSESRNLIAALAADGSTFVPLAAQYGFLPALAVAGIWQVEMENLIGEQWLFELSPGIYAVTTRGRSKRTFEYTVSVPGFGLLSLRASGRSVVQDVSPPQLIDGPHMRIPGSGGRQLCHVVAKERDYEVVTFLIRTEILSVMQSRAGLPEARLSHDVVWRSLPTELVAAVCKSAAVQISNVADVIGVRSRLFDLLTRAIQHMSEDPMPLHGSLVRGSSRHAAAAWGILMRTLSCPPDQRKLARMVGTNERKLVEEFRRTFGVTPSELVKRSRMDWARTLVLAGEMPLNRVADTIGFADAATFSRAFRAHFGMAPRCMRAEGAHTDPHP